MGVIPNNAQSLIEASGNSFDYPYAYCGDPFDSVVDAATGTCTNSTLDYAQLTEDFNSLCVGNQNCTFNPTSSDYVLTDGSCYEKQSRVYIQYLCIEPAAELQQKREAGLAIVVIGLFVAICYMLTIWYLKNSAGMDFKVWDLQNTTATDFTIEFGITDKMWNELNRMSVAGEIE